MLLSGGSVRVLLASLQATAVLFAMSFSWSY